MSEFQSDHAYAAWSIEDVLRVVFRRGLQVQAFPACVVRWAACFFGMLTGALQHTGQYLDSRMVQLIRDVWEARCVYTCHFARRMIALALGTVLESFDGTPVRGGMLFLCGSEHGIPFDCVRADAMWTPTPGASDLFSVMVRAMRGEFAATHGVPATYRHVEGHSFAYSHSRLQHIFVEVARTGHALLDGVGYAVAFDGIDRYVMNRLDDVVVEALGEVALSTFPSPTLEQLLAATEPTKRDHSVVRRPTGRAGCKAASVGSPAGAHGLHTSARESHD